MSQKRIEHSLSERQEHSELLTQKSQNKRADIERALESSFTAAHDLHNPITPSSTMSPYTNTGRQRPLIDQVNNQWQDEKSSYSTFEDEREFTFCDLENEGSCPNLTRDAVVSRRFGRMLLILLMLVVLACWTWNWYLRPQWVDDWDFKEGFLTSDNGTFGVAKGGHFDGVRVQDLEASVVPGGDGDPDGKRRLIFVGDIHGCAHELKKLLKKVNFNEKTDHLIAAGDVISKGPDNVDVLDQLIKAKASSVRGNHEDRILAMAPSILESALPPPTAETSSNGAAKDAALLRQLSKHHLKYLRSMPLMLRIPPLPLVSGTSHKDNSPIGEEILVVHAGLVPAVSLKKQDPYFVMNMRAIHTRTHLPLVEAKAKKGKSKPWHDIWCWYNDRLFKHKSLKHFRVWEEASSASSEDYRGEGWFDSLWPSIKKKYPKPQVVVYGHRSKEGLQIERWTKGLDTGCVKGGELTALVLDAKGTQEIVQVGCKDYS